VRSAVACSRIRQPQDFHTRARNGGRFRPSHDPVGMVEAHAQRRAVGNGVRAPACETSSGDDARRLIPSADVHPARTSHGRLCGGPDRELAGHGRAFPVTVFACSFQSVTPITSPCISGRSGSRRARHRPHLNVQAIASRPGLDERPSAPRSSMQGWQPVHRARGLGAGMGMRPGTSPTACRRRFAGW